ncbi:nucleoside monophosphate kinase [uncultured Aquimarina sp.]|uniref:nucleoside monophosphate kinase n=1 Tax=uncultured Aquimarina sp. TaxID=575652 RepID=UPI00261B6D66|nr:nucleoside monophosphate kinase [uncultured Aquimarina sp.]
MIKNHLLITDSYVDYHKFSSWLSDCYDLEIISIAEIVRLELRSKSLIGSKMLSYIENGELIPNNLLFELIEKKMSSQSEDFLMLGFPRTLEQFSLLIDFFNSSNISVECAWYLKVINIDYLASLEHNRNKATNQKFGITEKSIKDKMLSYSNTLSDIANQLKKRLKVRVYEIDYEKGKPREKDFVDFVKNV